MIFSCLMPPRLFLTCLSPLYYPDTLVNPDTYLCILSSCRVEATYLTSWITMPAGWPYLFIGFTELIIISHVYGIQNFLDDVFTIVGIKKSNKFIKLQVWGKSVLFFIYTTLAPLIIFVILIISWSSHEPLTKGEYIYPKWANDVGWAIAMIAICSVPFVAILQILWAVFKEVEKKGLQIDFGKIWKKLLQHTEEWRQNEHKALQEDKSEENGNGYDNKAVNVD